MTALVKEELTMEIPYKTYLQTYEDHVNGYKQYKLEKAALAAGARVTDERAGMQAEG